MLGVVSGRRTLEISECLKPLIRFWLGWDKESIADLYDRNHEDVEYRKLMVEQTGIGFAIPSVSLNSLKNSESEREGVAVAA